MPFRPGVNSPSGITAANISYDNTASGLAAGDVQTAIDELADPLTAPAQPFIIFSGSTTDVSGGLTPVTFLTVYNPQNIFSPGAGPPYLGTGAPANGLYSLSWQITAGAIPTYAVGISMGNFPGGIGRMAVQPTAASGGSNIAMGTIVAYFNAGESMRMYMADGPADLTGGGVDFICVKIG